MFQFDAKIRLTIGISLFSSLANMKSKRVDDRMNNATKRGISRMSIEQATMEFS